MKEIVGNLDENRARQRTAEDFRSLIEDCRQVLRSGHAAGKARQRRDDFDLLRCFMQRAATPGQKRRSNIGADQKHWSAGLQTFQQRHQSEQIPGPSGREDDSDSAAATIETISGKAGCLFMADDPVMEFGRLAQRLIKRDVVDAGYPKP